MCEINASNDIMYVVCFGLLSFFLDWNPTFNEIGYLKDVKGHILK